VKEEEYLNLARQSQFNCVGQVFKGDKAVGSCVLIGDKFVLSAAHVFIEHDFRLDTLKMNGQTVIINRPYNARPGVISNYSFSFNGKLFQGVALNIYPVYLDSAMNKCDIAVIELKEIVNDIVPASINNSFNELHSNVTGVGFGESGIASQPETVTAQNKKIAGENVIDTLTGYSLNGKLTVLTSDFDSPANKDCNKMGSATPRPLEYMPSGGDSGGGLFRKSGKAWELIGICSETRFDLEQFKKTGYYGQTMGWTRVSVFADWINKIVTQKY
jgi:hypothetical protein